MATDSTAFLRRMTDNELQALIAEAMLILDERQAAGPEVDDDPPAPASTGGQAAPGGWVEEYYVTAKNGKRYYYQRTRYTVNGKKAYGAYLGKAGRK